jgi:hypothetical protein
VRDLCGPNLNLHRALNPVLNRNLPHNLNPLLAAGVTGSLSRPFRARRIGFGFDSAGQRPGGSVMFRSLRDEELKRNPALARISWRTRPADRLRARVQRSVEESLFRSQSEIDPRPGRYRDRATAAVGTVELSFPRRNPLRKRS